MAGPSSASLMWSQRMLHQSLTLDQVLQEDTSCRATLFVINTEMDAYRIYPYWTGYKIQYTPQKGQCLIEPRKMSRVKHKALPRLLPRNVAGLVSLLSAGIPLTYTIFIWHAENTWPVISPYSSKLIGQNGVKYSMKFSSTTNAGNHSNLENLLFEFFSVYPFANPWLHNNKGRCVLQPSPERSWVMKYTHSHQGFIQEFLVLEQLIIGKTVCTAHCSQGNLL